MCQQIQNSLIFFALKGEKKLIGNITEKISELPEANEFAGIKEKKHLLER